LQPLAWCSSGPIPQYFSAQTGKKVQIDYWHSSKNKIYHATGVPNKEILDTGYSEEEFIYHLLFINCHFGDLGRSEKNLLDIFFGTQSG